MLSVQEFSEKIKTKYPVYKNVDDSVLVKKILEKYPTYRTQVDLNLKNNLSEKSTEEKFDKTLIGKGLKSVEKGVSFLSEVAGLPKLKTLEEIKEENRQRRLSQEKRALTKTERLVEDIGIAAKEAVGDAARFAAFVAPIGKGTRLAKIAGAKLGKKAEVLGKYGSQALQVGGLTTGFRFVEELAKDEDIDKSVKTALKAGVGSTSVALALPLVANGSKVLAQKIAQKTKKKIADIQEVLIDIPSDDVQYALGEELAGRSIFRGSFDPTKTFDSIGKKAQKAINFITDEAGKFVGVEKELLKKSKVKIKTNNIIEKLDEMLDKESFRGETSINLKDMQMIKKFKKKLIKTTPKKITRNQLGIPVKVADSIKKPKTFLAAELNIIKNQINDVIKKRYQETVSPKYTIGEGVLMNLAKEINEEISSAIPRLAKANKYFSKVKSLRDRLITKLKDENVSKNVRNLYKKDTFTKDLFFELDELAPTKLKFKNELRKAVVRDSYEKLLPAASVPSALKAMFIGTAGATISPAAAVAGAAITSPRIGGKATIKTLGNIPRYSKSLGRTSRLAIPLAGRKFAEENSE